MPLEEIDDGGAVFRAEGIPDRPAPLRDRGVPLVSFRQLHHIVLRHRPASRRQHDPRPLLLLSPELHVSVLHLKPGEPSLYMEIQPDQRHDDDDGFCLLRGGLGVVGINDVLKNEALAPPGPGIDVKVIVGGEGSRGRRWHPVRDSIALSASSMTKRNMACVAVAISVLAHVSCATRTSYSVVKPVSPSPGAGTASVTSTRPKLEWQLAKPSQLPDTTYDLVIYEAEHVQDYYRSEWIKKALVYSRDGLKNPEHQVETSLKSGQYYIWSVRYRQGAKISKWAGSNRTDMTFVPIPGLFGGSTVSQPFVFMTPPPF
jgi:hypothetical protein